MTYNQIQYWNLQELIRSNQAREQETNRHNVAVENETHRSNVVYERETIRHNKQNEAIGWGNLSELSRHNKATESEAQRHNMVGELISYKTLQENIRNNKYNNALGYVKAREEQRHNKQNEVFSYDKLFVESEKDRQLQERKYYQSLTKQSYDNIVGTSFGVKANKSKTVTGQLGSTKNITGAIGGLTGIFFSAMGGGIASSFANSNDLYRGTGYHKAKNIAAFHQPDTREASTYSDFLTGMRLANSNN